MGCRTLNRWDAGVAGQEGLGTGGMQDRRDVDNRDAAHEGCGQE